jgi:hypothetical protein
MIEGLSARWVSQSDDLKEIELSDPSTPDAQSQLVLTTILVVGPPDPNALSYLVPRAVFERGQPVHVGALNQDTDLTESLLDILEVMNPHEIAVFICDSNDTLSAAVDQLEPQHRSDRET